MSFQRTVWANKQSTKAHAFNIVKSGVNSLWRFKLFFGFFTASYN
jgi:hypothetical protein